MRKLSQREALRRALQKVIENADKPALEAAAEALAECSAYSDERDNILVVMDDANLKSKAFSVEQAQAVVARNERRATLIAGMNTRNAVEAKGAEEAGEASDIEDAA